MSSDDDIVKRLRLTPVLMYYDVRGYPQTDYEACKRYINNEGVKVMSEAADEIERLRKERDEARREVCLLRASTTSATEAVSFEMIAFAASRGWEEIFADDPEHERDA